MRARLVLLALAIIARGAGAQQQRPAFPRTTADFVGAAVEDSSAAPHAARDRAIAGVALARRLKGEFPSTVNVAAFAHAQNRDMALQFDAPDSLCIARGNEGSDGRVALWLDGGESGVAAFDRLTQNGAAAIRLETHPHLCQATFLFQRTALWQAGSNRGAAIRSREQNGSPWGDEVRIEARDSVWSVRVTARWERVTRHIWWFSYDPRRDTLELKSESGPPVPPRRNRVPGD